jgi:hypothetical protein
MVMKKAKIALFSGLTALLLCGFMILSCSQDSVFYYISREEAPKDPRIKGSPTNIIVIDNTVFAGSRMGNEIHYYRDGAWKSIKIEGESRLVELAAAGCYLYALFVKENSINSNDPVSTEIKRINKDSITSNWDVINKVAPADGYFIESICGAGNEIFAGGRSTGNVHAFLHIRHDPENPDIDRKLKVVKDNFKVPALLNGAAIDKSGNVFLATGAGIYKIDNTDMTDSNSIGAALAGAKPVEGTFEETDDNVVYDNMVGILAVTDNNNEVTITAVSRDKSGYGYIHIYDSGQGKFLDHKTNERLSGAMCVWKQHDSVDNAWKPVLLLLGVSDFGTEHGYREMVLDNGKPTGSGIKSPDKEEDNSIPCSIKEKSKYAASIGKYPIMAILQLPETVKDYEKNAGGDRTIFAATSTKGLWSYKLRDDWGWNAED